MLSGPIRDAIATVAYKEDVRHFVRTFHIESREELRTASRASVIA